MNALDEYVNSIIEDIKSKNITDELSIVKYVYLDLGTRISFDSNFIPFGNSKYKQNMYRYHSTRINDLNECLINHKGICKSISKIFEYVTRRLGVNVITVLDEASICMYGIELTKYPHVYNIVALKDGREFVVDLQDDIHNIKTNSFTSNFGNKSLRSDEYVINKGEQRLIDISLGYISNSVPYTDEYLSLLKYYIDIFDTPLEKLDFILSNIDASSRSNMSYIDRQWYHKDILEAFFTLREFDYYTDSGKIKFINAYRLNAEEKEFICFIQYYDNKNFRLYIYNEQDYKYEEISLEDVAKLCLDGLVIHKSRMHGLDPVLKRIKEENKHN